jgi:hypothetical protein
MLFFALEYGSSSLFALGHDAQIVFGFVVQV